MALKYEIEYGRCLSDWKDGINISNREDFIFGEKYGEQVQAILKKFSIPLPDKDKVYRGTHHDMLFLNNHGLTVRIGGLSPYKFLSPTVAQPIGWESIPRARYSSPLTVAVYHGDQLLEDQYDDYQMSKDIHSYAKAKLENSGILTNDDKMHNFSAVKVFNDVSKKSVTVPLFLDVDDFFMRPTDGLLKDLNNSISVHSNITDNQADIMAGVIYDLYGDKPEFKNHVKAFEVHQPLRQAFSKARKKGSMDSFFDLCHEVKVSPKVMKFPVYKIDNGKHVEKELRETEVSLHTPWTRRKATCAFT